MATFITFAQSQTVTSAYATDRSHKALACFVASYGTAAAVTVQFATASGTGFLPLFRQDGSGLLFTVCSGTGGGVAVIELPPSAWGRFVISSAQTSVISLQLESVLR